MKIKSILATAAVVLGLGIAPALAAGPLAAEATGEGFAALSGVPAEALSAAEMDAVEGLGFITFVCPTCIVGPAMKVLSLSTTFTSSLISGGIKFEHGGCPGSTCGNAGRLDGWTGDPLPRGF